MNEFYELEKKCKKLMIKKLLKVFIILIIFLSVVIGGYVFYKFNTQKPKPIHHKIEKKLPQHIKHKNITKEINKTQIQKKTQKVEKPIVKKEIKQKLENIEPNLTINIDFSNVHNIKISQPIKKIEKKKIEENVTKIKKVIPKKKKKIVQDETITFAKALILAQNYYDNGDYENSMKWCKFASRLDNNNEQIWKLYALNLYKIGQKQKAIKILKTYLKYRDSLELKYLLQRFTE